MLASLRLPRPLCLALAGLVCGGALGPATAAEPNMPPVRLQSVFPAGGQRGTTFDLDISGRFFDGLTGLHFSGPGITAQLVPKTAEQVAAEEETPEPDGRRRPREKEQRFHVTIGADVKPAIYELRALGAHGVSSPHALVVGADVEKVEVEPNNDPARAMEIAIGSVVDGRMDSPVDVDYFRFHAQAGQRLILDCAAWRIDSPLDAVLTLFGPGGEELERSHDSLRRDPLLDFTAAVDGDYVVSVRDQVFQGSKRHIYRLSIGTGPHIDFVFPPAGTPGSQDRYRVFGRNLPGGQPAEGLSVDRRPLEMVEVSIPLPADPTTCQIAGGSLLEPVEAWLDAAEYQLEAPGGRSNSVSIGLAGAPVVAEQEPNDNPAHCQAVNVPCEIAGQFYPRRDRDGFKFQAQKGEQFWIEVFAQRLGLPADPRLVVQKIERNEKGEETLADIATVDDDGRNPVGDLFPLAGDDPLYQFIAPADGTYRVTVTDLAGSERSDPRLVYRLVIRRPQPEFRLVAVPRFAINDPDPKKVNPQIHAANLRRGGTDLIEIVALRRDGFDGEITVSAAGLPPGVTALPVVIGPGQTTASLVLAAADDAPDGVASLSFSGTARIGDADVVRAARLATMVSAGTLNLVTPRARLARDLVLGVVGSETAPFSLSVAANPVLEQARPGILTLPVSVVRHGEFKGAISLVTMALPPGATAKEAVTIAPDQTNADIEIKLGKATPVGTCSFFVNGLADPPPGEQQQRRFGPGKLGIASPAVKLVVAGTTVHLAVTPPGEPVRQGTRIELPITLERLYGYNEPVLVRASVPEGVADVAAAVLTIQRGTNEGKLAVTLGPTATVGVHKLTITAIAKLAGQELPVVQEIELDVQPAAAPAP